MAVRVQDRGYNKLVRNMLKRMPVITVGVHGDEGGAGHGNTTVADIATIHEFGLGNHPERSFIRAWFDSNRNDNNEILRKVAQAAVKSGTSPETAAERAALALENSAKGFIQGGSVTPETEKEGTTLIETAQLVTSIRGKVNA